MKKKILITGSAGFIGFHLSKKFLDGGWEVWGYDGMTEYYDVELKEARNKKLEIYPNYKFICALLEDEKTLEKALSDCKPDIIVHLAAQAGVRYSFEEPKSYIQSNLVGSFNLLNAVKDVGCSHLLLASTSSVYGANVKLPFSENDKADKQVSLYAATKKSMEVISHTYSHLYQIPVTCFRFFTVYGPWGSPDMALFKFTKNILTGEPIDVYNHGKMSRDFTYVDDLIRSVSELSTKAPQINNKNQGKNDYICSSAPWRAVNIAGAQPVSLEDFILVLEDCLGVKAKKNLIDMQPGDVRETFADVKLLKSITGYVPNTSLKTGITSFVKWYREYFSATL